MDLNNIVGFKAIDADGNEQNVTVDEMVDMISTRMVMALSETSTFAAAAAVGNDVYENELPTVTDAANVRVLQSSGDAAQMTMQSLASKLGELIDLKYDKYQGEVKDPNLAKDGKFRFSGDINGYIEDYIIVGFYIPTTVGFQVATDGKNLFLRSFIDNVFTAWKSFF